MITDPFDPYFDDYSIRKADLVIPSHFRVYTPDVENDPDCLSVIAVDPTLGATYWTQRGRWITIGIYRDTGRVASQGPLNTDVYWSRSGNVLTFDPNVLDENFTENVRVGDQLDVVGNVALNGVYVTEVLENGAFRVQTSATGAPEGFTGTYRFTNYDFSEQNVVFRILPWAQISPISEIIEIFNSTAPLPVSPIRSLYNVTTETHQTVPNQTSFTLPLKTERGVLGTERRFEQIYDAEGNPLKIDYLTNGQPQRVTALISPDLNERVYRNLPVDPEGDERVFIYDLYGVDLNEDPTDIITRDEDVEGDLDNIVRATDEGEVIYTGELFDLFGNEVIGIQENNALVVKARVLPLAVDRFNRPVKQPLRRNRRNTPARPFTE